MNWVLRHFGKLRQLPPWAFCWRVTLEGAAVSLLVGGLVSLFVKVERRDLLYWPPWFAFVALVLVAPPLETLMLQALPVGVVRRFHGSFRLQVGISTLLFAALHFPEGVAVGVTAGVVGGVYFAFTFAHWVERSWWTALWATCATHAARNGALAVSLLVAGVFPSGLGWVEWGRAARGQPRVQYFYTADKELVFACAYDGRCGDLSIRSGGPPELFPRGVSGCDSARIYGPFTLRTGDTPDARRARGARGRPIRARHDHLDGSLYLDGIRYDLRDGRLFWIGGGQEGEPIRQLSVAVDPATFRQAVTWTSAPAERKAGVRALEQSQGWISRQVQDALAGHFLGEGNAVTPAVR